MKPILSFFDFLPIFWLFFSFSFHFCFDLPQVSGGEAYDSGRGLITGAGKAYDSGRWGFLCAFLFVFSLLFGLLLLFLRRVNEEVMHIATQLHVFIRHATETWCRVTRESDSRRLRLPPEPSTHSCEQPRARKTGAQLRDTRRSAKNDAKCVKKPLHCCSTPSRVPFSAAQLNVRQLWR